MLRDSPPIERRPREDVFNGSDISRKSKKKKITVQMLICYQAIRKRYKT